MLTATVVLYIPFQLIWRVRIKLSQKLTLACSLCLTVIVIIFTVTRASGLEWQDKLDVLWEVYFQIVAAEVGLILIAMTAFRALFVSRAARNQHSPQKHPSFWAKSKLALRRLLDPRRWMSKHSKDITGSQEHDTTKYGFDGKLPGIPGATMTGVNTFINHQGEDVKSEIDFSTYALSTHENQGAPLFSKQVSMPRSREHNSCYDKSQPEKLCVAGASQQACSHCSLPIDQDTP